jgi:gliding motility-associated-like protein
MYNQILDLPKYANAYGWPVLNKSGNPVGDEVMDVMPGFWNGSTAVSRDQGELYRSLWLRVLQNKPKSIWLNSYNETWEHTSVEPSYMYPSAAAANPSVLRSWTDYYGKRMDDFYWVMTKQYNRLFMYKELFKDSYLQEDQSSAIYVVKENSIDAYGTAKPSMAPVLLVPKGFVAAFTGKVIDEALDSVGQITSTIVDPAANLKADATNILTPNGDGKNDLWIVKDIDQYPGNEVKIFDRQGRLVYDKKAYTNDWNGNYRGGNLNGQPVPAGVYLYVIDYGNGKKVSKGTITILR